MKIVEFQFGLNAEIGGGDTLYLDEIIKNESIVRSFFESVNYKNKDVCTVRKFKKKEVLIKKDEPAKTCMLIVSGKLRVYNEFPNGRNYLLENVSTGEIIGEMECAAGIECYTSTVETVTPCVVIAFSREIYNEWLENYMDFARKAARRLGGMICEISNKRGENIVYSSELTLALLIERLYQEVFNGQYPVLINETREFMSDKSGFSLRSVNRAVSKFKDENLISIIKGKIVLTRENHMNLMDFIEENL